MIPQFSQVLLCGPLMLAFYLLLLAWLGSFIWHLGQAQHRRLTQAVLWAMVLLMLGISVIQSNLGEIDYLRDILRTPGAADPTLVNSRVYLFKASSSLIAACAMVLSLLSAWGQLLPRASTEGS